MFNNTVAHCQSAFKNDLRLEWGVAFCSWTVDIDSYFYCSLFIVQVVTKQINKKNEYS